ncbi:MAG: succinate dehydrogenase/fumarate reductase iron-sulfur subunit [Firmicutes bacterium]|nr:succinate dehydrogenase/fumarate reductase iron-sulfur subunit [Bacillota bacterium]
MKVFISRFLPDEAGKEYLQEFDLENTEGETVLGVLLNIKEKKDSSLSFRYNCRNEHCGECGIRVNGKPVLACREIATGDSLVIKPLARFPVIKDLVVDVKEALNRLSLSLPPLNKGYSSELDPQTYEKLFLAGRCNTCLLCQSVCPLFKCEEEKISGPAFFVTFAQHLLRPFSKSASFFNTLFEHKFLQCTLCGNCSKVCPQGVDPRQVVSILLSYLQQLGIEIDEDVPLMNSLRKKKEK